MWARASSLARLEQAPTFVMTQWQRYKTKTLVDRALLI